ncbi:MAG: hypothetical protein KDA49_14390 [Rhodospirillaceae bacterium]|nr:hypothetical protein [Rhodospirillaceae bacterium]MCA8933661.1 hypothetical protein [Rhodospirillaceae bacterium]
MQAKPEGEHPKFTRISDVILDACQLALDQRNLPVAEALHQALELVMTRSAGPRDVERRTVPEAVLKSFDQIDALRRDLRGHHS